MRKSVRVYLLLLMTALTAFNYGLMAQQADNTLTKAEKKAGWILLFDGKSTPLWRPYQNRESDGWEIANGEIYCKEKDVKHRADLITK